jgi:hypothetical protein
VVLAKAQRLSRCQSLRMDPTKSTGRFFVIPASQSLDLQRGLRMAVRHYSLLPNSWRIEAIVIRTYVWPAPNVSVAEAEYLKTAPLYYREQIPFDTILARIQQDLARL